MRVGLAVGTMVDGPSLVLARTRLIFAECAHNHYNNNNNHPDPSSFPNRSHITLIPSLATGKMIHTCKGPSVSHFPKDMDVYSFMFEYFPPQRPDVRNTGIAMIVDEESGQAWSFEQVKERVDLLSVGMRESCGVGWDHRVAIFSPNAADYPVALWASHRIGAVVSAANPAFQPKELSYQLEASQAKILFIGEDPVSTKIGLDAAERAGIPRDHIVIIQSPASVQKGAASNGGQIQRKVDGLWTVSGLIEQGREYVAAHGAAGLNKGRRALSGTEGTKKLALLSFSSGTTGLPKGVAIQHSAPIANILQAMAFNKVGSKIGAEGRFRPGLDVALGILPQFHIYGLIIGVHFMFWAGVRNVIMPKFRGIEAMIKTIIRYDISIWWLVPPQIVLLCKDPCVKPYIEDLRKRARFVMVGAAPLSDDLSRQFMKVLPGIDWGQGYGMTETCTVTTMHPPDMPAVLGSAGRIFSNTEAKIVRPDGKECGIDEPGELWIRGPQCTLGYANNEAATKEMFLPDGFVRTGDEVKINAAGDVFIVDRLKELIKVKGFQVPPAELEGFLLDHPDVSDCGVIGLPDESAGELPLAFVALNSDAKKRLPKEEEAIRQSIMKFVADNKVKYKHLCGVVFIDAIPKTASGKILRRNMRDMAKQLKPSQVRAKL